MNRRLRSSAALTLRLMHMQRAKAAGFDDLNSNIVLHITSAIKGPLFHILNLSICEGVFPELLKISKVNPIFKEGDRSELCNYRPISLIPIFSKIFERIVYNRVFNHMKNNNLFYKKQYGFQKNCSTEPTISETSAIRPSPYSPQAISPLFGPISLTVSLSSKAKFRCVAG